ncbi:heat shock protein beta-1-like [Amphibalanus amphitrite]|uniref:heat shock protein beta-1-like n=1 Tax=Amphibalanus amphitrite TaxID=1232801 RepID=UPI001C917ABD|nr:heat shock protein beta-1-like [Amphibalanus amphitrite]XP_043234512.1 heat shock protein beta-1-like [Amphibalanus amphitrite]
MAKRNIPVKMGDFSIIDTEFSSIRERFDAEMRKMEDEMNKFRSELISREMPSMGQSSITSSTTSQQQSGFPGSSLAPRSDPSTWLDNLNSPLIQDEGDQKQLKLRFDVSQYKPEEIVVKTVDNKLLVHAKHEEKSDSRSVYREYNREFLLPQGSNPEMIKSSLSKDGILTVEAPLPALEGGSGHIPITHQ